MSVLASPVSALGVHLSAYPEQSLRVPPDFMYKTSKEGLWLKCRSRGEWKLNSKVVTLNRQYEVAELSEAVEELDLLWQKEFQIDPSLLYRVLKRCISQKDLLLGRRVHALALKSGYESDAFLAFHIIRLYASHGRLVEARQVFSKVAVRNCHLWASIIAAHGERGQTKVAVELYRQMRGTTVKPNSYVFVAVLKACAAAADLDSGKEVHADVLKSAAERDVFVGNSLVDMYSKCGRLDDARRVFNMLQTRDVVTWNAMMAGYVQQGFGREALALYASMREEGGTIPDRGSFTSLLRACASVKALHQGIQLHAEIQERGLETDMFVANGLVNMYAKCGSLEDACRVFDRLPSKDVVTWNTMIAGYVHQGLGHQALLLYERMQQEQGIAPANHITFSCLLQACASVGALHQGRELHAQIYQRGLETDVVVGNCLVEMYAKCGSLDEACRVFDILPTRDVVTWTAIITGYVQQDLGDEALAVYARMQQEGITSPNHVTYASLLQACAGVGALQQGKQLHAQIRERGLEGDLFVGNSLLNMYAKCGNLADARSVFNRLPTRDIVTWNTLLKGYAEHSDGQMAMQFFEEMCQQGIKPTEMTFICLLVACSHEGLAQEGHRYFRMMVEDYAIVPTDFHYNCMVDILGRSGHLDEAENMLQTKPFRNYVVGWTSLLSACKSHNDAERGKRCFDHLVELEPNSAAAYVLLGNIYANAGMWHEVEKLENLRKSAGATKKGAKACIEVKNKVHSFTVGGDRADMSSKLKSLNCRLKEEGGHVPQTQLVLRAVCEQDKEDSLCGHAEKLALAYGLLNTPDGTTLLVTKNLRMCNDCHSSTKIMSRLEKREIIVRDAHRVHRFLEGCCSCGDRQ